MKEKVRVMDKIRDWLMRSFFSEVLVDQFSELLEREFLICGKASLVGSAESDVGGWAEETNAAAPADLIDFQSALVGTFLQLGLTAGIALSGLIGAFLIDAFLDIVEGLSAGSSEKGDGGDEVLHKANR